jgi:hypothetical protein
LTEHFLIAKCLKSKMRLWIPEGRLWIPEGALLNLGPRTGDWVESTGYKLVLAKLQMKRLKMDERS